MDNNVRIGKTARLLNRLPHFYNPEELGKTFLELFTTIGNDFEACERDIFDVLRSHHVLTAENIGSKGFIANQSEHGDLDKLFSLFLEVLGGTSLLTTMNPLFNTKSFDVEKIVSTLYLSDEEQYKNLRLILLNDSESGNSNSDPLNFYSPQSLAFEESEICSSFILSLLTKDSKFTEYVTSLMDKPLINLLFTYDGNGVVSADISSALSKFLNETVLKDPFLYQKNCDYFNEITLDAKIIQLRNSLNKEFLKKLYSRQFESQPELFDNNKSNLNSLLSELEFSEPPCNPVMNDIQRFNRSLIDSICIHQIAKGLNWGFIKREIPSLNEVRVILRDRFNNLLLAKDQTAIKIFQCLAARLTTLPQDSRFEQSELIQRRLLLESIFPYEMKHIYRIYQERLQALIKVLRKGASTKQGVKDIVAANFGMTEDTPEIQRSKSLIQIKEFDPVEKTFYLGSVPLNSLFSITNNNQDPVIPKIKITLLDSRIKSIRNIVVKNPSTNTHFHIPVTIRTGDTILIQNNEPLIVNGVQSTIFIKEELLELPSKKAVSWLIDAEIQSNTLKNFGDYALFGNSKFGTGIFINEKEPIVLVEILSYDLTPSSFSIYIPWTIEGVTDNFAETTDHPRHKIRSLVNKVKAAGVRVNVSYLQQFTEFHELDDQLNLGISGNAFNEMHNIDDTFSNKSVYSLGEVHELTDSFSLKGTFGYTKFNSGNSFA